ncbi:hypothetical protein N0V82_007580 [Gnomoniopsis sp. IMI 355080]|nr:hypothetical protein N0V82_007580 [Gnomoniopsis sp. IMI 355080]
MHLNLGLDQLQYGMSRREQRSPSPSELHQDSPPPNQFVVLLYNLLLADMHQAMAFFLNVVWVAKDGIFVRTSECWIQGLFISNGDLASSCFIATIALHTYLTVVRSYRPPEWALNSWIVGMWVFIYGMTIAGIASTNNGKETGGYYVRASAWCWINESYDNLRLITHYMYIFLALVLTPLLYAGIFMNLRERLRDETRSVKERALHLTNRRPPLRHKVSVLSAMTTSSNTSRGPAEARLQFDHHPAFLVYPLIYVVCTLPLAMGRVGTLAGADVPYWYFCMAGALITSNGWLDVLLWGTTRHTIVFGPIDNADALGLETFNFMRTPPERRYGNIVWVQGATDNDSSSGSSSSSSSSRGGGRSGAAARRSRTWWGAGRGLLRRFFGGAEETATGGYIDEDRHGGSMDRRRLGRERVGSGILGRPDFDSTYQPGHVKYATDPDNTYRYGYNTPWWSRDPGAIDLDRGIAVQKDTVVSIVTVDKSDLESGARTPDSIDMVKDGYI